MEKKRDHQPKRDKVELRPVPEEETGEELEDLGPGEEVVRLGSETIPAPAGETPKLDAPKVRRLERVGQERLEGLKKDVRVDLKSEDKELDKILGVEGPSGKKKEEVEDLEEVWSDTEYHGPKVPIGWVVLLVAGCLSVLVVALWKIPKGDSNLESRASRISDMLSQERQTEMVAEALNREINDVVTAYLAAETVEEKAKYVRMPERVLPLMEDYYARKPMIPQQAAGFYYFESFSISRYPFLFMKMQLVDGGQVSLMLEEEDGVVKVDWESHVAYQAMSLEEYVEKRPAESYQFRVIAQYDEYYAEGFTDTDRWVSLTLTERDTSGFLFGYVERGSETHARVKEVLGLEAGEKRPMIVKVRYLPDAEGLRSVEVEEVVAPGWALIVDNSEGE